MSPELPGSGGRRIVLWRHGRTTWNVEGRFQGQLDPHLDETGLTQAARSAAVLAALRPAVLVTSDLQRAVSTAAALAAVTGLAVQEHKGLREIELGTWQGLTRPEVAERFAGEYDAWLAGEDVRRGHGETYAEVGERCTSVLRSALADVGSGGVLVAVVHGGTARAAIGSLLEIEPASWWRFSPLGNCRWSVLVEAARGWRLEEHNAGQLPSVDEGRGDDR
ncbi:MAG: glucosyl-3-phosphoglycerate phosphatase [Frankiales bacterium]|nr:glucosyl-3-phosphoglycerate phosphatase [Frankiales bacterium]